MPEVVRICYNSILQNAGNHPVRLITETNYKQYLSELPHISEMLKRLEKEHLYMPIFLTLYALICFIHMEAHGLMQQSY